MGWNDFFFGNARRTMPCHASRIWIRRFMLYDVIGIFFPGGNTGLIMGPQDCTQRMTHATFARLCDPSHPSCPVRLALWDAHKRRSQPGEEQPPDELRHFFLGLWNTTDNDIYSPPDTRARGGRGRGGETHFAASPAPAATRGRNDSGQDRLHPRPANFGRMWVSLLL